jgi:hypothetical protein
LVDQMPLIASFHRSVFVSILNLLPGDWQQSGL